MHGSEYESDSVILPLSSDDDENLQYRGQYFSINSISTRTGGLNERKATTIRIRDSEERVIERFLKRSEGQYVN